ncbi:MAG TPA: heavy metal-binding domain-containing protein [Pyrinomonadaceae bacterium]|nr:heavy metal-binding domain-containing protein [Pyrinomonadaceae bacterium]
MKLNSCEQNLWRALLRLSLVVAACLGLAHFDADAAAGATQRARRRAASAATVYTCPMHAGVSATKPGSCPLCNMKLIAQGKRGATATANAPSAPGAQQKVEKAEAAATAARVRALEGLAPSYEFACVMHPEVRQAQEGVCAKCGMPLSTVRPTVLGAYKLAVTQTPRAPRAGEPVRLNFVVTHPETGARVRDFVLNHEKLFHLFIVSADMNVYQHIHPELDADGSFKVETILPRAGLYKLHSDFFPAGGTLQVLHHELTTAGYRAPRGATVAPAALVADKSFTKMIDGMKISLEWGGARLVPGAFVRLKYSIADARTGEPVRDLEPYLGAWGHTLILDADQSDYLHSHPTETLPEGTERANLRGGPEVEFGAMFPEAGLYRIWTQFQRHGRVSTVSFTVRVNPATS